MTYPHINVWAVLVSAAAFWGLGALWYSPLLFSKRWMKELGITPDNVDRSKMGQIFGLSFVLMLLMVWALNFVINTHKPEMVTLGMGFMMGVFTGFFFCMMIIGVNYLYQRKSFVLWLIDGFYVVIGLGIAGMILAVWR